MLTGAPPATERRREVTTQYIHSVSPASRVRTSLRALLAASGRHYPLKSGCGKIASHGILSRLGPDGQPPEVVTTLRNGARMWVDLDDYIGKAVFYFGDFDPKITWVLARVLRPGDTVVDIGANAGLVTLFAAQLVGAAGSVHAVEPQPALAEMLKRSSALNSFEHVQIHELALSEQDRFQDLWIPEGHSGMATLEPTSGVRGKAVRVPIRQAGQFLREISSVRPRLLKIDVEGHEAAIFRGAREYLEVSGPDVLLFEEHRQPAIRQESIIGLQSAGYAVFAIPKAKLRMRLYRLEDAKSAFANDFVAVRRGRDNGLSSALGVKL